MSDRVHDGDTARLLSWARLAQSHSLALRAREAAGALVDLGRYLRRVEHRETAHQYVAVGRQLAIPGAIEIILARAAEPAAPVEDFAAALRLGGPAVGAAVLERLNAAEERTARRGYFNLAVALAAFPEIRGRLVAGLRLALGDARWEVVRNALTLLAAVDESIPAERCWDLAHAPHRQVRIALVQVIARWRPGHEGLELLVALLEDQDPGVRFATAMALGNYAHPRARQVLARRVERESDPETRAVCAAALQRRVVELRSA